MMPYPALAEILAALSTNTDPLMFGFEAPLLPKYPAEMPAGWAPPVDRCTPELIVPPVVTETVDPADSRYGGCAVDCKDTVRARGDAGAGRSRHRDIANAVGRTIDAIDVPGNDGSAVAGNRDVAAAEVETPDAVSAGRSDRGKVVDNDIAEHVRVHGVGDATLVSGENARWPAAEGGQRGARIDGAVGGDRDRTGNHAAGLGQNESLH